MTTIVLVAAYAIEVAIARPPVPVVVATDVGERLLHRPGAYPIVSVWQLQARGVHVEAQLHLETALHIPGHIAQRARIVAVVGVLCLRSKWLSAQRQYKYAEQQIGSFHYSAV